MPLIGTSGAASSRGFGQRTGANSALFDFAIGTSVTLRPITFGSYGMSQARWEIVFAAVTPPWWSNRLPGVGTTDVLTYVTHPEEQSRGNPQPGVIFGVTGFPKGIYRFTLRGGGGGSADPGYGAPGGIGTADVNIASSDIVFFTIGQGGIYTGGATRANNAPWYFPNPGGWNGGGAAGAQNSTTMFSGSGGGGTDIRLNGYTANTTTDKRILVAGGGGGATDQHYNTGGAGGGFNQNGQQGGYTTHNNPSYAGQGGALSAGGQGALYQGTLYETYMNGSLWSGGRGYDGSQTVESANAAGGGGGGYYGGGGAVDEGTLNGGGAGGGSGYADTSVATNISGSLGGANNGHCNWSWRASTVDNQGRNSCGYTLYDGSTQFIGSNNSSDALYSQYQSDGTWTHINYRYGDNGSIAVSRIS